MTRLRYAQNPSFPRARRSRAAAVCSSRCREQARCSKLRGFAKEKAPSGARGRQQDPRARGDDVAPATVRARAQRVLAAAYRRQRRREREENAGEAACTPRARGERLNAWIFPSYSTCTARCRTRAASPARHCSCDTRRKGAAFVVCSYASSASPAIPFRAPQAVADRRCCHGRPQLRHCLATPWL